MADIDEYSPPGLIFFNGRLLSEVSDVTTTDSSNDNAVYTLRKGLAGFSNGAEEIDCEFTNMVPAKGAEQRFGQIIRSHQTVTLTVKFGKETTIMRGRLMTSRKSSSHNSPNQIQCSFKGRVINETSAATT